MNLFMTDALIGRAKSANALEDWSTSIADATRVISVSPKRIEAYFVRGWAYRNQGKNAEAVADYKAVLAQTPTDLDTHNARMNLKQLGAE